MRISMLLFDGFTQLDLTGPYEVLARMPETEIALVAKSLEPVCSDTGLRVVPTHTFADAPEHDVLFVPGGPGVNEAMLDDDVLAFVKRPARYTTSVCTGALILGAAGLLQSRAATTHWNSVEFLPPLRARHADERIVVDGDRITAAGVSAGIDFALRLVAELRGPDAAKAIQLAIEYDPQPPFDAGSPKTAPKEIVDGVRRAAAPMIERRRKAVEAAAKKLSPRA
ncbi:MAG TPA: DJ-1/PfpI family protein [Thermoanaerobaculia bacterium]|nr:DJ-1/PfpI family protein [Thermoanaerobaculia bacterium]